MALINCPECQKQISDQAQSCPQCGYPLARKAQPDFEFPFQKPLNELAGKITLALYEFVRPPAGAASAEDQEDSPDNAQTPDNQAETHAADGEKNSPPDTA